MLRRRWFLRVGIFLGVAAALVGLAYAGARPARLPWAVASVPAEAQDAATAALTAAGYTPLAPPAWAGEKPAWRAPGRYRLLFLAAPAGEPDIFQADLSIDTGRHLAHPPQISELTNTPAAVESAPVVAGRWLAYATHVGSRYQSITCFDLADPAQPRVFVFAQPPDQVSLAWQADQSSPQAAAAPRLLITVVSAAGRMLLRLDPDTALIAPDDGGLVYVPATRGEQAWLPNLVSRVRELPGVGPEKIAFVENVFFTAQDRITRWLHGGLASTPVVNKGEAVAAPTSSPGSSAVAIETGQTPPGAEPTAASSSGTPDASGACRGTDCPSSTLARSLPADASSTPIAAPASTTVTATVIARDLGTGPSATSAPNPTAVRPTVPVSPTGRPLAGGVRRRTPVYPDPQRPYASVELVDIDPVFLQIKMVAGTVEPRPATGLIGTGVIPPADRGSLVAAFNGGFAAMHGAFGLMIDRKVYLPARSGIATLAVYDDGSLRMGTWGKDLVETPDMVSFRQNCPPLIENGTITAETGKLTLWGLSVANEVYLYRSGLGLTTDGRLVYAAGRHLSAYTLARALQLAGAVYAMQLDVDEFHVAFITYQVQPSAGGGEPVITGHKLKDDMRGFDGLFLRPFQLDFFYLVRRSQPLAEAVRRAGTGDGAVGEAAIAELPGHLAFSSARDGNWELYVQQPGRPDTVRRLTFDPADDLYPAWSPDGSRLAFSSRRGGNSDIYQLDPVSLAVTPVTRLPSEEWAPAWSPDGKRLIYQSDRNGQSDIYLSAIDGSGEVRLTPMQGNHESPHWAPDGSQIAFDSDLDVAESVHASINLYVMSIARPPAAPAGTYPRRIYDHGESPAWSPDGRRIAFTSLRGGRWQILVINADGSGARQMTTGAYDARYPAWSPDGRWLAFAGDRGGRWEIYVIPADGAGQAGTTYPLQITTGAADSSY
ncbi:MAG TPA: phosphodiester glycosidase family protein, partial [Anaerolineae bacterium]